MKTFSVSQIDNYFSGIHYQKEVTYFVRDDNDGLIKIGKSMVGALAYRLSSLQTGNPRPLQVVGIMIGNREREIHKMFKEYKVRGEWYRAGSNLIAFIVKYRENIPERPSWRRGLE